MTLTYGPERKNTLRTVNEVLLELNSISWFIIFKCINLCNRQSILPINAIELRSVL